MADSQHKNFLNLCFKYFLKIKPSDITLIIKINIQLKIKFTNKLFKPIFTSDSKKFKNDN